MKFYASVRIDVRRSEQIKSGTEIIGNHIKCKVVKNKVSPPFKTAEFDIIYGTGISKESEIIEIGAKIGVLEKSGSWYSYNGQRIGQGKDAVKAFFKTDEKTANEVEAKIRAKLTEAAGAMTGSVSEDDLIPSEFDEEF